MTSSNSYDTAGQLERTLLAWHRSALAVAANGALISREGLIRDSISLVVTGLGIAGIGATMWIASTRRYGGALNKRASYLIAGREGVVVAATVLVILLSFINLVLALAS